jgi:hypothetical protein
LPMSSMMTDWSCEIMGRTKEKRRKKKRKRKRRMKTKMKRKQCRKRRNRMEMEKEKKKKKKKTKPRSREKEKKRTRKRKDLWGRLRPTRSDPRNELKARRKRTMPSLPRRRLSTKKGLKPWTRKLFKAEVRRNELYISENKRKENQKKPKNTKMYI